MAKFGGRRAFLIAGFAVALSALSAPARPQEVRASGSAAPSPRFGTGNPAIFQLTPLDFSPTTSTTQFVHTPMPPNTFGLETSTPYGSFFAAPTLPSGALLSSLNVSYCNGNPPGGDDIHIQLEDTDVLGNFVSILGAVVAQAGDDCSEKTVDLTGLNYTVDNATHQLLVIVLFGPNPSSSAIVATGFVTITYQLQVSRPPITPSFGDVPITDPAYKYIEALAASGITAGCGGGNFCPDNPVTRRQMAVFLSKALGLSYDYGTLNPISVTIPEWQFWPIDSSIQYADTGPPQYARYFVSGDIGSFTAGVSVPAGARLDSLEFDYCDDRPSGSDPMALVLADLSGNTITTVDSVPGNGCASAVQSIGGSYTAGDSRLLATVLFGIPYGGTTSRFLGAVLSYRLQVSAAPATPTFGDVPTTDPGFAHIEALAASGITGGCGGGNFCPANPITRRQMAVFLSKALGLSYH